MSIDFSDELFDWESQSINLEWDEELILKSLNLDEVIKNCKDNPIQIIERPRNKTNLEVREFLGKLKPINLRIRFRNEDNTRKYLNILFAGISMAGRRKKTDDSAKNKRLLYNIIKKMIDLKIMKPKKEEIKEMNIDSDLFNHIFEDAEESWNDILREKPPVNKGIITQYLDINGNEQVNDELIIHECHDKESGNVNIYGISKIFNLIIVFTNYFIREVDNVLLENLEENTKDAVEKSLSKYGKAYFALWGKVNTLTGFKGSKIGTNFLSQICARLSRNHFIGIELGELSESSTGLMGSRGMLPANEYKRDITQDPYVHKFFVENEIQTSFISFV